MSEPGRQREEHLTGGERELESALRELRASRPTSIDAVSAAFEAGRRAAVKRALAWKTASAALAVALAVSLSVPTSTRRAGTQKVVATSDAPAVIAVPVMVAGPSYYSLRADVLDRGVDALSLPAGSGSVDATKAVRLRGL